MVIWLTCTHGRYKCLQRNLRCYLDQDYTGESIMFVCNTGLPLKLSGDVILPDNKKIYIDNPLIEFTSVGEKYNHALKLATMLNPNAEVVISADDDDIFLPNHLSEGMKGLRKGETIINDCKAYKPYLSYFRSKVDSSISFTKMHNTLEPSIFVKVQHLLSTGYANVSVRYHQQWLDPLLKNGEIFIDKEGEPTLIYNWGDNGGDESWDIFKMSGTGDDSYKNFMDHKRHSKDMGSNILTPAEDNTGYYNFIQ